MRQGNPVSIIAGLVLVVLALAAAAVCAQDFPTRPVRIIVPYGSGTGIDIVARLVSRPLGERLRQPVIVENRPGGSAMIGVNALKQAAPDGYTIGILVSANAAQPWLVKDIPFDIRKDFMPMTLMYSAPLVMTVPQEFPAKTLGEFIAYAKANPGKIFYGSLGVGTTTHLSAELLKQVAGFEATNVPYKGSAEMHNATAAANVQMTFDNYVSPRPLVDAGKLRALAITSLQRSATLPAVPAIAETFPGVEISLWTGIAAPLNTPKDAFDLLTTEIRAILHTPEIRKRLADTGSEAGGTSPAEFAQLIATSYEKFGKVIRSAGIKAE